MRSRRLPSLPRQQIVDGGSFATLIAQLRRSEADGHDADQALQRALRAGPLHDAENPAAVIAARIAKHTTTRPAGTRRRRKPDYIARLIPHARGPMPADMDDALVELAELIETRATALVEHAINEHEPWVASLGPPPAHPARRAAWQQHLRTIAAYRDRYKLTGSDPLGRAPSSDGRRVDSGRAAFAARQARDVAVRDRVRRGTRDARIEAARDFGR